MKRTWDAELFDGKCPYTGEPCYDWECDTCEIEAEEKKSMEELDRAESEELDFIQPKKTVRKLISVDVLDKIRAEIKHEREEAYKMFGHALGFDKIATYDKCIGIIDKYKAESEDKECQK